MVCFFFFCGGGGGRRVSDVINHLNMVRGKGMAAMYSWSCKRYCITDPLLVFRDVFLSCFSWRFFWVFRCFFFF